MVSRPPPAKSQIWCSLHGSVFTARQKQNCKYPGLGVKHIHKFPRTITLNAFSCATDLGTNLLNGKPQNRSSTQTNAALQHTSSWHLASPTSHQAHLDVRGFVGVAVPSFPHSSILKEGPARFSNLSRTQRQPDYWNKVANLKSHDNDQNPITRSVFFFCKIRERDGKKY